MIPDFDSEGNLPPGVHWANWNDLTMRFGYNPWRQQLLAGLSRALANLKQAGCQTVYIDGSFVTRKDLPQDYDACWEESGVDCSMLDRTFLIFDDSRAQQKAKYMGEFFPATSMDATSGLSFLAFFQTNRRGNPKGVVALNLRGFP